MIVEKDAFPQCMVTKVRRHSARDNVDELVNKGEDCQCGVIFFVKQCFSTVTPGI